ncbi:MAG: hypothetical protein R3F41_15835 [Gammaproteobacteria bacterium]|nr:hypothetical protein [Pseudomonadales bacterium]MCP5346758.1 hypothetical protein [Pseudomonadales bacterium]
MIEIESDVPFLWCLSPESSEGFCAVSMVVSYQEEEDLKNLTIETSVLSLSSDSSRSQQGEMLEWNEEDVDLFLKMVNYRRLCHNLPIADTLRIDFEDPAIVEIINVVAAAGFGTAYMVPGLLKKRRGRLPVYHGQIGGMASLNTVCGFKPCAIVDVDGDEVVCVLLDDVEIGEPEDHDYLHQHDLLLVKREDLLHPGFTGEQMPDGSHVLH